MERARRMGFDVDTPLYHGTRSDFEGFDIARAGQNDHGVNGRGVYLTPDASTANVYAQLSRVGDAPNILPTFARVRNPLELDSAMLPRNAEESIALTERAKARGHDGIVTRTRDGQLNEVIVFDPSNIRSRFAAFDPARSNSRDLLAGIAAPAAVGGALSQRERRR